MTNENETPQDNVSRENKVQEEDPEIRFYFQRYPLGIFDEPGYSYISGLPIRDLLFFPFCFHEISQ